ncbi:MAG TPA: YrhK family protein [Hyphomicrobiales bacterium]|nr:YrhK family protein [Hyphomicrobiales bacterium]
MFKPKLFDITPEHARVYGYYERIYTIVDLTAALTFLIGSMLFFYPELVYAGTWLFVIGSILFATRPAVRFLREYHLAQLPLPGDDDPSKG